MRSWTPRRHPRPHASRDPGRWTQAFARHFPPWLRERGEQIFAAGDVVLEAVSGQHVRAMVLGTEPYVVELRRHPSVSAIALACSCPYYRRDAGPCKHLWALLLAAEKDGRFAPGGAGRVMRTGQVLHGPGDPDADEAEGDEDAGGEVDDDIEYDDDFDDEDAALDDPDLDDDGAFGLASKAWRRPPPQPTRHTVPPRPSLPPRRQERWAEALTYLTQASAAREASWPAEREIVYTVDPAATMDQQGVTVALSWRQRTAKGGWTKPKPLKLQGKLLDALPDPADRAVWSLLLGARNPYEGSFGYDSATDQVRLRGDLEQIVLPMMLATGRGFVRDDPREPPSPLVWDGGEPWEFWVTVAEDKGDYVISGSLRRGGVSRPLAEPLVLTESGLVVFPAEAARLDHAGGFAWVVLLRQDGALRVPRGEAQRLLGALTRSARPLRGELPAALSFEPVALAPRPRLALSRPPGRFIDRLVCELSFDYGGCAVAAGTPGWAVLRMDAPRVVARDAGAESAAADRLRALGVRTIQGYRGDVPQLELTPSRLPRLSAALLAEGWLIERDGALHRAPDRLRLGVRSGIDWFDLEGAAEFGDRSVPLPDLVAALERGAETIDLGDGTLGVIPEDWKRRLALVSSGTPSGAGAVRFTRGQAVLLDALLEAHPAADVDRQFAELRARLHAFAGVRAEVAPPLFEGRLRSYQQDGLGWMRFLREFGFGGVLADDMGLGKTVQLLALLESRRAEAVGRPSLVVVPKSLVFNWKEEAARFTPTLRVLDHTGLGRKREAPDFAGFDVVLTTYGVLRRDILALKDVAFDYVVLDEAQAVKNASTGSAKAVRLLTGAHRLALSGTPVENHVGELASILEFTNPGLLGRTRAFQRDGRELGLEGRALLARTIRPFVLRRTKEQVAADLPPRTEQVLHCRLDAPQRSSYDALRDHYRDSLLRRVDREGMARSKMHVLEALLRLRQAACHPGLVDPARAGEDSAKMDTLLARLRELRREGHKALVFSQFTRLLALVQPRLQAHEIPFAYLDGRTRDRAARVRAFQEDPHCGVFLVSLKAGGLGLNLTAASYVFILDPWWNPAVEAQAIDRTHRIGQTRAVFAYRLIAEDTVEEKILQLQESKRELARALITEDHGLIGRLRREDLELLLS
jgi:superfamily II DNA or RNA helicase